jgi:hypothetical protein
MFKYLQAWLVVTQTLKSYQNIIFVCFVCVFRNCNDFSVFVIEKLKFKTDRNIKMPPLVTQNCL